MNVTDEGKDWEWLFVMLIVAQHGHSVRASTSQSCKERGKLENDRAVLQNMSWLGDSRALPM